MNYFYRNFKQHQKYPRIMDTKLISFFTAMHGNITNEKIIAARVFRQSKKIAENVIRLEAYQPARHQYLAVQFCAVQFQSSGVSWGLS